MREKKVRGINRKSKDMVRHIKENTLDFPMDFFNDYWHMHLPASQGFVDSSKTPFKVRKLCVQTLLERADHLKGIKPDDQENYRVVTAINLPSLWDSQIIIFRGKSYFDTFFERDETHQKWLRFSEERNIQEEWGVIVPDDMQVWGFKEYITDEDEFYYEGEI
ncbi:DUF3916 domain-containing protein [Peribacillus sp. SCS-26]|uniref:DUF3916 domain-containing protein n=1 Tax=Paraperibacillus marinus TaxID=3115295 RepID=UPI00390683D3